MPKVFLSYARNDLAQIESLEVQLKQQKGIAIWRDQHQLYGGQRWPKMLGEAIAKQEVMLLAWSHDAAASHFVEFEWTTALALKKPIVPCLLDDAPLPPALCAIHAIPIDHVTQVIQALANIPKLSNSDHAAAIIEQLDQINTTDPQVSLAKLKTVLFDQKNWTVKGNVIQGEQITIHLSPNSDHSSRKPSTPPIEKWHIGLGIFASLLTIMALIIDLPTKLEEPAKPSSVTSEYALQRLKGSIHDESNEPLSDVSVTLLDFKLTTLTDQFGQFHFEIHAPTQKTVELLAQKPDYHTVETDATLGNTALSFTLRKKP